MTGPVDTVLADARRLVPALADEVGEQDVDLEVDPTTPSPPGQGALQAQGDLLLNRLRTAQHGEARSRVVGLDDMRRRLEGALDGELLPAPTTKLQPGNVEGTTRDPISSVIALVGRRPLLLAAAALGIVEMEALKEPVETALLGSSEGHAGWALAGSIAALGVFLAHSAGARRVDARRASGRASDQHHRASSLLLASAVVIAVMAAVARVAHSTLSAQVEGAIGVDPTSIALFALFQVGFVLGNMAIGAKERDTLAKQEIADADEQRRQLASQQLDLQQQIDTQSEVEADELGELGTILQDGLVRYHRILVDRHPSVEGQIGWSDRLATGLSDGSLFSSVFPHLAHHLPDRSAATPETGDAPAESPETNDDTPARDPDPVPTPEPTPPPRSATPPRSAASVRHPRTAPTPPSAYASEDDLIDDILGRA